MASVMPWAVEAVEEYLAEVRPLYGTTATSALWLTGRGTGISTRHINERFSAYRDAMGLPAELTPHCLRHSYVSHLVEDGIDPLFVQQQVGHAEADRATTSATSSNGLRSASSARG